MKISDIKIGNRFRKDLGNVELLAKSIQEIGLLHPVVVNENKELIAGQRRIQAFKGLGINEIPTTLINLQDITKGEFHENNNRKSFTMSEDVAIYEAIEKTRLPYNKAGTRGKLPRKNHEEGRTAELVSKYTGKSEKQIRKERDIVEATRKNPEQFNHILEKIDSGQTSINYAHKMVKRAEDHKAENIPKIPVGQFDIILADPPWQYEINTRGSPDDHYGVMTNKQIQDLNVPSADNSMLFLWATGPKLPEALKVISEWGFKYKTSAVWIKDKKGTGYYFRGQHELLLVAEKGDMPVPQEKDRPSSVIQSPRGKHSEKPEVVYSIIETLYPNRSYLELFARKEREGWTSWGNELNK
jgi:N6-adenosine-specific RNA methylase IME4